jgi:Suppressor of fused protein (SUFU)
MSLLEQAWEEREEVVYKKLFQDTGLGIYPLDFDIFEENFNQESCDPRWLHYGVFKSPPNKSRPTWLYISRGMSNPWESDNPEEYSGFGTEFILETKEEADWAINIVRNLVAYNILLAHGLMGNFPMLDYGDRIPFSVVKENGDSPIITHLMIVEPDHYQKSFKLSSGHVNFLHVIGITTEELKLAKATSSDELLAILKTKDIYPITDRNRECVM